MASWGHTDEWGVAVFKIIDEYLENNLLFSVLNMGHTLKTNEKL